MIWSYREISHAEGRQKNIQSAGRAGRLHRLKGRAGLRALQERDAAVERWLNEEVGPTYDAMKANPKRGLSARSVFAEARARYTKRKGHR
jgi:hypothetical protein